MSYWSELRLGDRVLIEAEVLEKHPNCVDVRVEMFSKTDQYSAWVKADACQVRPIDVPQEPAEGTILDATNLEEPTFFMRRDDAAANEPERRYVRRWYDVSAAQWIDWPDACRRGADPTRTVTRTFAEPTN